MWCRKCYHAENRLSTVEDVTHYTKAGGGCGKCKEDIARLIRDVRQLEADAAPDVKAPPRLTMIRKIELIRETIDREIRPRLKKDGGDVELLDVDGFTGGRLPPKSQIRSIRLPRMDMFAAQNHDYLMFFTNTGKAYRTKAYEIPEAQRTAKGTPAVNFLNLMQRERITAVIPIKDFEQEKFLIAVTKNGTIKKMNIADFDTSRKAGLIAIKLKDGDELIGIKETTGTSNVIIVTRKGKCICFSEEDVRTMGRAAGGVRAITMEKNDEVVAMELAEKNEELLVVTRNGYGKRTKVKEYKIQARGGKGLLTYDKTKFNKTGELIGAMVVNEEDDVFLINSDGIIIRIKAGEVSRLGRTTQGVRIMRVQEESIIVTMAKAIREDEMEPDADESEKTVSEETKDDQLSLDVE